MIILNYLLMMLKKLSVINFHMKMKIKYQIELINNKISKR